MNSDSHRSRSLREIELEVLEEGREWTRRRLEQKLQEEANRQGGVFPPQRPKGPSSPKAGDGVANGGGRGKAGGMARARSGGYALGLPDSRAVGLRGFGSSKPVGGPTPGSCWISGTGVSLCGAWAALVTVWTRPKRCLGSRFDCIGYATDKSTGYCRRSRPPKRRGAKPEEWCGTKRITLPVTLSA